LTQDGWRLSPAGDAAAQTRPFSAATGVESGDGETGGEDAAGGAQSTHGPDSKMHCPRRFLHPEEAERFAIVVALADKPRIRKIHFPNDDGRCFEPTRGRFDRGRRGE